MYQNNMNAAPYRQGGYGSHSVHSVHVGGAAPLRSNYQQSSVMLSKSSGGAFKKRLNSFLDDEDGTVDAETAEIAANAATAGETSLEDGPMSKNDMLKQAKDRKKIAKANLKNKL
jgi:hypothetical protein